MEGFLKLLESIGASIERDAESVYEEECCHSGHCEGCPCCEAEEREEQKEELSLAQYLFLHLTELHNLVGIEIKRVIFADEEKKTIVLFKDGTKEIATCSGNDVYSRETGIMVCILKRIYGSGINSLLNEIADETEKAEHGKSRLVYIQKKHSAKELSETAEAELQEATSEN